MKFKYVFAILLLFLGLKKVFAQEDSLTKTKPVFPPSIAIVSGKVTGEELPLKDAVITIYKNDDLMGEFVTDYSGNFNFTLQRDNNYLLVFGKKGYTSKKIFISTNDIPENITISRSGILVDLFREMEGLDVSILDEPIGKFYYISTTNNLEYDKAYTDRIRAQLEELQRQLKQKQKEEAEKESKKGKEAALKDSIETKLSEERKALEKKEKDKKAIEFWLKSIEEENRKKADEEAKSKLKEEEKKRKEEQLALKAKENSEKKRIEEEERKKKEELEKSIKEQEEKRKEDERQRLKAEKDRELEQKRLEAEETRKQKEIERLRLLEEENQKKLLAEQQFKAAKEAIEQQRRERTEKMRLDSIAEAEKKEKLNKQNEEIIAEEKSIQEMSEEEAEKLFNKKMTPTEKNNYLKNLAKKYPEGMSVQVKQFKNFKLTQIIKIDKGKASEFKKIEYRYGSFYKKNGDHTTDAVFNLETKGYEALIKQ